MKTIPEPSTSKTLEDGSSALPKYRLQRLSTSREALEIASVSKPSVSVDCSPRYVLIVSRSVYSCKAISHPLISLQLAPTARSTSSLETHSLPVEQSLSALKNLVTCTHSVTLTDRHRHTIHSGNKTSLSFVNLTRHEITSYRQGGPIAEPP